VALASLAVAALATPAAHAAGIVVRLPDREARIDEATLRDSVDVSAGTYTLRAKGGAGDAISHPPAVSLPRLLELAGVAPDALSFVSIRRPNGTLTVLRSPDLARPAPFPEGPPLVWLDADSVRFLRPVRDDADVNGADNIATAGDDLAVRVHQGPLLEVALRVAPSRPRARERARLEARVTGAQPGAALTVRWRFGDGTDATGPAVSHRWRTAGVYSVVATAAGDDDSGGASEPLVVRVGAARERSGPAGGGTGDRERSPATGPAEQPDNPAPLPSAEPDAPAPADRTASAPRAAPARSPRPAGRRTMPRKQSLRANRDVEPASGVRVRGVLLAARLPAGSAAAAGGALRAPAGARQGESPEHRDATLAAGGALECALLMLGAWRERRRRQP
jgi:PKD domain